MDLASLVLRLEAQTAEYDKKLAQATTTLGTFEKRTKATLASVDKAFKGLGASAVRVIGLLAGGALFRGAVNATAEAEASFAQLEAAVNATGGAAGFTAPQLAKMAGNLQDLTTFSDESVMSMQAVLLQFTRIRGPVFKEAQQAIVDVAARMHTDLSTAALTVGKALDNPIEGMGALQKAGVRLSESQKQTIKDMVDVGNVAGAQGLILGELEKRFAGAALAARQNFSGALQAVKNQLGELLEAKGGLPGATANLNELAEVLKDPGVKQGADDIFSALIAGATKYLEVVTKGAAGWKVLLTGRGGNDAVDVDNQIRELVRQRDMLANNGARGASAMDPSQKAAAIANFNQQIAVLEARFNGVTDGTLNFDGSLKEVTVTLEKMTEPVTDVGQKVAALHVEFGSMAQDAETALNKIVASFDKLEDIRFDQFGEKTKEALAKTADESGEAIQKSLGKWVDVYNVFLDQAARNTQDTIANTLINGFKGGAKGVLQSVGEMIRDITAQLVAADLTKRLFGDVQANGNLSGGWVGTALSAIGAIFGGTRDSGGRGEAGKAYKIGTGAQPEMFVPDQPGHFTPANAQGGGETHVTNNFHFEQPQTRQTQTQVAAAVARGISAGQRRNG